MRTGACPGDLEALGGKLRLVHRGDVGAVVDEQQSHSHGPIRHELSPLAVYVRAANAG